MHPVAEQAVIAYDELRGVRWHLWNISALPSSAIANGGTAQLRIHEWAGNLRRRTGVERNTPTPPCMRFLQSKTKTPLAGCGVRAG